jgi:tetratricopeptide (TPR) repeat protein
MAVAAMLPVAMRAQAAPPQAPANQKEDNPFPGDASKSAEQDSQKQSAPTQKPGQAGQVPPAPQASDKANDKKGSDNPFPGEDAGAPIIPVDSGNGGNGAGAPSSHKTPEETSNPGARDLDGDPVKSPDGAANVTDDGFSSSRAGLDKLPAEDDSDGKPGKSVKNKTREQVIKENVDIGGFYLSQKNWKAAQMRFQAAFALDGENPDSVWGLAEAEKHLNLTKEAIGHYQLFLSYDPEGPHGKEARKALEQLELAQKGSGGGK